MHIYNEPARPPSGRFLLVFPIHCLQNTPNFALRGLFSQDLLRVYTKKISQTLRSAGCFGHISSAYVPTMIPPLEGGSQWISQWEDIYMGRAQLGDCKMGLGYTDLEDFHWIAQNIITFIGLGSRAQGAGSRVQGLGSGGNIELRTVNGECEL